jgi:uncharacterized delta-60 repeat protein
MGGPIGMCDNRRMKAFLFFVAAFAISLATPSTQYRSQAQDESKIGPEAARQIYALVREKESRTPAQRKIDSQLVIESKLRRGDAIGREVPSLRLNIDTDEQNKLELVITARVDQKLLAELSKMGIAVTASFPQYNYLTARMSLDQLEAVAAFEQVRFIRPQLGYSLAQRRLKQFPHEEFGPTDVPTLDNASRIKSEIQNALRSTPQARPDVPVQIGIASSQGDMTHRSFSARGTFNVNGAGVRIGVVSDGVENLAEAQASGDLGPVTVLPGQQGLGDEGTAMLEIIHDVAPGAELYFASGVNNLAAGFAENIRALRAAGCDIIVDDIRYFAESPFQDGQAPGIVSQYNGGVVTQAVNDVVADGALYFSSAGNFGNENDGTSATWEGDFANSGPMTPPLDNAPPSVNVHDFDPSQNVEQFNRITAGGYPSPIILHWNDPIGGSANDYDIYILGPTAQSVIVFSNNTQNGTQDPVEAISQQFNSTNFRIVVAQKQGAQDRFIHLSNYDGLLRHTTGGETYGHSAASRGIGVAAVPAVPTFPNAFSSLNNVEIFSSDGPRRFFRNGDGTPITPGNLSSTGGSLIQQPVFAAADGVSISGAGRFDSPFFGTSAAAPHAAAIAALIKSADPSLNADQVKGTMIASAIDIESPGADRDSGHGLVMPYEALRSLGGPVIGKAFLQIGEITQTETCCNSDGYILPGEQGSLRIELKNSGLLNASGITTTLTTTTPGVTIQTGASVYPDVAAETGGASNITPFVVSIAPTVPHDPIVTFKLTVNYSGGHATTQVWDFPVQFGFQPRPFDPQANATVNTIAVQPDGKILVGGNFNGFAGLGLQSHSGIGRINPDGTIDVNFDPGCNARVNTIAVQPDGKIVIGGGFSWLGGGGFGDTPRSKIGRLNPDGTLDIEFNPGISRNQFFGSVWALLVQPDGKILVGGDFSTVAGQPRNNLARLNPDGTLDNTFNPIAAYNVNHISSFALQTDGKIVVAGVFTQITDPMVQKNIVRINADGSMDLSFNSPARGSGGFQLQPDGKLLIYGNLDAQGGVTGTTSGIARLNADGSIDQSFVGAYAVPAFSLSLQTDGKIIAGGAFTSFGGGPPVPHFIAGLDTGGALNGFAPGANSTVYATALESSGMLLVGGDFTYLGRGGMGQDYRRRVGRISNTSLAVQQLSVNESATEITWLRSGTSPEVYRVTFESSPDGSTFTHLGNGTRIAGGWHLPGLSLSSQDRYIRARGFYSTGASNSSGSIVETLLDRYSGPATISGRVLSPSGVGIRNVLVYLTDSHGVRRSAITSSFGIYTFQDVPMGNTYFLTVASKRFRFAPQSLHLVGNLSNIDLNALE